MIADHLRITHPLERTGLIQNNSVVDEDSPRHVSQLPHAGSIDERGRRSPFRIVVRELLLGRLFAQADRFNHIGSVR